ncbi:phosphoglycolate phosphatase [Roseateles sp. BYS180W]|uniref:phosphoglycolate phosphatase n=1 Tax=Roseateles rivi TaxID=3299028 RepID=A0ABW7FY13_9BURK
MLFDLDGTLVDSAPDLAAAANELRHQQALPPLPLEQLRPYVGTGARGMLAVAMNVGPDDASFEALRQDFLCRYERIMLERTALFAGVECLLRSLESDGMPWGIVTNKAERFALPIVHALGLSARAAAVIAGDTTPYAKPHPRPLLEAAVRMGVDPEFCLYLGDDARDMQAARAAGMGAVAAAWGYLGPGADVNTWAADVVLQAPQDLLALFEMA